MHKGFKYPRMLYSWLECKNYPGRAPSFSNTRKPFSMYSSLDIQKSCLSFMIFAKTAPPVKTMPFLLGGSSILILNFYLKKLNQTLISIQYNLFKYFKPEKNLIKIKHTENFSVFPFRTLSKYNCLSSLSKRLGRPGYMVDPPDRTMCL